MYWRLTKNKKESRLSSSNLPTIQVQIKKDRRPDTQKIDDDYMNHHFEKYCVALSKWESKTFRDFITEYKKEKEDKNIAKLVEIFWVDEKLLKELIISSAWSDTVTPYSKFEQLKQGINKEQVKHFFEQKEWTNLSTLKINIKASNFLEQFILYGGFEF